MGAGLLNGRDDSSLETFAKTLVPGPGRVITENAYSKRAEKEDPSASESGIGQSSCLWTATTTPVRLQQKGIYWKERTVRDHVESWMIPNSNGKGLLQHPSDCTPMCEGKRITPESPSWQLQHREKEEKKFLHRPNTAPQASKPQHSFSRPPWEVVP
ncbi:hypothetical protein P7K49_004617 [Saguinus oedipus]|uniref:Uncharacterized protein n=1 Tax=Saguinus oedipus TaxID=9490 RepID=A0ABQ9W899_SAGOE|nr:hypothetical protein P7K49_004617 [Saguinus oedipus]